MAQWEQYHIYKINLYEGKTVCLGLPLDRPGSIFFKMCTFSEHGLTFNQIQLVEVGFQKAIKLLFLNDAIYCRF